VGVAVKVTIVAGQTGFSDALTETLTGMLGLTVTVRSAVLGPLQPAALAVIVAVPLKVDDQFITPVAEFIVPAAAGALEYVIPVELEAVAV
jgi:hypothetical protein